MELLINNLYSVLIKGWENPCEGVLIAESENWILINQILTDYILDGLRLICKKSIKNIRRNDKEYFEEKVLKAAHKITNYGYSKIPNINNIDSILHWLKTQNITFQIFCSKEHLFYVGKIDKLFDKSLTMVLLNNKGKWLEKNWNIKKKSVRLIDWNTDYVKSLILYNQKHDGKE